LYTTANLSLPSNSIEECQRDQNGVLWAGSTTAGVFSFDGSSWTNFSTNNSTLPDNYVESVALSPFGNIWVGTLAGGVAGIQEDSLKSVAVEGPINSDLLAYPTISSGTFSVSLPMGHTLPAFYQAFNQEGRAVAGGALSDLNSRIDLGFHAIRHLPPPSAFQRCRMEATNRHSVEGALQLLIGLELGCRWGRWMTA
jgi:hypothetical protein